MPICKKKNKQKTKKIVQFKNKNKKCIFIFAKKWFFDFDREQPSR